MKIIIILVICFSTISCSKRIRVVESEITVEGWYQSNGRIELVNVKDGSDFVVTSCTCPSVYMPNILGGWMFGQYMETGIDTSSAINTLQ